MTVIRAASFQPCSAVGDRESGVDEIAVRTRLAFVVSIGFAACSGAAQAPVAVAKLPDINAGAVLTDITNCRPTSSRAACRDPKASSSPPDYITKQFIASGLVPGNPDGTWTQKVPLVGLTPEICRSAGRQERAARRTRSRWTDEFVPFSKQVTDDVKLENSEIGVRRLRRAGAGVPVGRLQGRRRQGQDDRRARQRPAGADGRLDRSQGPRSGRASAASAMTYYGRWTYSARRPPSLGAAAVHHRPRDRPTPATRSASCRGSAASGSIS